MKWISTDEMMPTESYPVLCCDECGFMFVGYWNSDDDGDLEKCVWYENEKIYDMKVTHWMHLPERPED